MIFIISKSMKFSTRYLESLWKLERGINIWISSQKHLKNNVEKLMFRFSFNLLTYARKLFIETFFYIALKTEINERNIWWMSYQHWYIWLQYLLLLPLISSILIRVLLYFLLMDDQRLCFFMKQVLILSNVLY